MSTTATPTPAAPETAAPDAAPAGREKNGRFGKGNPGGPGNPYARLIAEHRRAIAEFMTPERRTALLVSMYEDALAGDNAARKLLLQYIAGKAAPDVDPDLSDVDEWAKRKAAAPMMNELGVVLRIPDPALPLGMVRDTQPIVTEEMGQQLGVVVSDPAQFEEAIPELEMAEDDEDLPPAVGGGGVPPSPNGDNGRAAAVAGARTGRPAPSPNGDNGRAAPGASAAAPSPNGGNGRPDDGRRRRTGG